MELTGKSFARFFPSKSLFRHLWLIGLFSLVIFGGMIRFFHLNSIPVSLYHDELDYVLTGESLLLWGTDLSGDWTPHQLVPVRTQNYMAELPSIFHAGFQAVAGTGPQSGHIPAAVFGMLGIFVFSLLIFRQTRKWELAAAVLAVMMVNPWSIHLSRMGYEAIISLFFQTSFVAGVWFLGQKKLTMRIRIMFLILTLASLFFAYFTYHAAKFVSVALAGSLAVWLWFQPLSNKWKILTTSSVLGLLLCLMGYTMSMQKAGEYGARSSEIVNEAYISSLVNDYRRTSLSIPGSEFVINKYTVGLREVTLRYLSVFDVYRLVGEGYESGFQFSLVVHSFFYLSTLPLVGLGLWWWLYHQPKEGRFFLLLLLVSPVASAISIGYQSIFRSALTYMVLLAFAGCGLYVLGQWGKTKPWREVLGVALLGILLFETINFGVNYLGRYGVVAADNHYFSEELLAGYVGKIDQPTLVIVEDGAYSKARSILAYNHWLPTLNTQQRQQFSSPSSAQYDLGRVLVNSDCPDLMQTKDQVHLVDPGMFAKCNYVSFLATMSAHLLNEDNKLDLVSLSSPIDSRSYFYVVNDPLCQADQIKNYIYTNSIADFNPVDLPIDQFCRTWMKTEQKQLTPQRLK